MPKIIIDENLCTGCSTCAGVCVTGIIQKASDSDFPAVLEENELNCLNCGHCESYCNQKALTLDFLKDEKIVVNSSAGELDSDDLGLYIKKRRSVRHFSSESVPHEIIKRIIDIARYAPSGGNSQPVKWIVIQNAHDVKKIAGLTVEWMKTLLNSSHALAAYAADIIAIWDSGVDLICHNAPHLVLTHLPIIESDNDITEGVIAMTYFDIAAPSFGIGSCWAGFIKMAAESYAPLREALSLPEDRIVSSAMMFGYSIYPIISIPRRNPADIIWS